MKHLVSYKRKIPMIFNIQRFSIHDGTGIRTTVFLKGCTLRCRWCNNPEGISFDYDLMYDRKRCISCRSCVGVRSNGAITFEDGEIRIHREKIPDASIYRGVCPAGALTVSGENRSIDEIIEEIKKDTLFYEKSKGGVTISGGEPLAQKEFLFPLLKRLKEENIHVCVETSLHTNWDNIDGCVKYIDVFLTDVKHTDAHKLKKFTGGSLALILDNFKRLEKAGARTVARVPVIPTFNNTVREMEEIVGIAACLANVDEMHFIPFHTLGLGKYTLLAMKYDFVRDSTVDSRDIEGYAALAEEKGLKARIGG